MERTDDDAPVRVPNVEREARRDALQKKLTKSVPMIGPLDPSHALFDRVHDLFGENLLRYIGPQVCTMRDQETLGIKKASDWKDYTADISSVRLLEKALTRRAMVFDMAEICDYDVFMEVITDLFSLLDVPAPPGYRPVSLEQIQAADELIFLELARACRTGIKPLPNGVKPMQSHLMEIYKSQKVQLRLCPLEARGGNQQKRQADDDGGGDSKSKRANKSKGQRLRDVKLQLQELQHQSSGSGSKGKGKDDKGKGKGKDDKGRGKGNMPPAMLAAGCIGFRKGANGTSEALCYGFNLGSCPLPVTNKRCKRGFHACAKPVNGSACGGEHPFTACSR